MDRMGRANEVARKARQLMNQHGLGHWVFQWDRAKRRLGCCNYQRCTISLSLHYVLRGDIEMAEIEDTILHEIAHAIAGSAAGHGPRWKSACQLVGANPSRLYDGEVEIAGRYQARCGCGRLHHLHRKPTCNRVCRNCRERLSFTDTRTGEAVVAAPSYKAVCPTCGRVFFKSRKTRRTYYCMACGPMCGQLTYRKV